LGPRRARKTQTEERFLARSRGRVSKPKRAERGSSRPISRGPRNSFGLFLGFALLGLIVYAPNFEGEFISDDLHYVAQNEYIHTPSLANMVAIWNPTSEVAELVENYAPVHLTLHAIEWQLFGPDVRGYHWVNVLLHAWAATLLALLFRRSGIPGWPAALGAAFFLLHPANVESIAWISQLKSSAALVLALGAILLHPRRPGIALILFALGLLAKPFAASALVVVALFDWLGHEPAESEPGTERSSSRTGWLLAWCAVVVVFAVAEALAFSLSAGLAPPLYPDPLIRGLMIFSVALRYVLMALSGTGLSTFHEPPPVTGFVDPWLLGGGLLLVLLGWRVVFCLRARSPEAVYWLWGAAGFAPLSGVVPLPYPMADRYLYFILPGLIGAILLAGQEVLPKLERRLGDSSKVASLRAGLMICALVLLCAFGIKSHHRASVFYSAESLMADAELNYPNGAAANTRKATRAARRGDTQAALAHLRSAHARGYNRVDHLLQEAAYGSMQSNPEFIEIKNAMARDWISRLGDLPKPSHYTARALAQAYVALDELEEAARVLEAAARRPGPISGALEEDARTLRREMSFRSRLEAQKTERAQPRD
jgi:uncharacterized membrane protein YphA (DoxX/SURF4 family)